MENVEEPSNDQWVRDLKADLGHLCQVEFDAEIAGNLVEVINAFNHGKTAKETATSILKRA